jgi:hypothetical protein
MTFDQILGLGLAAVWLVWLGYWWSSARNVKPMLVSETFPEYSEYRRRTAALVPRVY